MENFQGPLQLVSPPFLLTSTTKQMRPNGKGEALLDQRVDLDSLSKHWFWAQKVKRWGAQRYHLKLLAPLHIRGTVAARAYKSCTTAMRLLLHADQKLSRSASGVSERNSLWKICPHLHNAPSNEDVKWYFRDSSYTTVVGVELHLYRVHDFRSSFTLVS